MCENIKNNYKQLNINILQNATIVFLRISVTSMFEKTLISDLV